MKQLKLNLAKIGLLHRTLQQLLKNKEKKIETQFGSEDGDHDGYGDIGTAHLDVGDFFEYPKG